MQMNLLFIMLVMWMRAS